MVEENLSPFSLFITLSLDYFKSIFFLFLVLIY